MFAWCNDVLDVLRIGEAVKHLPSFTDNRQIFPIDGEIKGKLCFYLFADVGRGKRIYWMRLQALCSNIFYNILWRARVRSSFGIPDKLFRRS